MTRDEALRVLGLTDPFSEEELRQAYKEESFAWHPDRFTAGTKMHARAHEKFKSVNEAYSILKKSSGGNNTPPPESYSTGETEPQVLLTEDVIYFGSDPRLDTSSISMLNRKPAKVVLLDRGVMLFINETYMVYDSPEFIDMIHSTNHWIAERSQFDFEKYNPYEYQVPAKTILLRVADPSAIRESISVRLNFQNSYLAARFFKEAAQRFCPRKASEERQAYFNKKREAAAKRKAEAEAEAKRKAEAEAEAEAKRQAAAKRQAEEKRRDQRLEKANATEWLKVSVTILVLIPVLVGGLCLTLATFLGIVFTLFSSSTGHNKVATPSNEVQIQQEENDLAVNTSPMNPEVHLARGHFFVEKAEYDRAIKDYSNAIELAPSNAAAYYSRGIAFYELSDYENAISDYTKAIEFDPNYHAFYLRRGTRPARTLGVLGQDR